MQKEIFGISPDEEGISHINQLYKKLRIIFIGAMIWSVINLVSTIIRLTAVKQFFVGDNSSRMTVVYSFLFFDIILFPLQGYYYYAFSKQIKLSIEEKSQPRFNNSFRLLSINATLVLLALALNFLSLLFNMVSPLFMLY